MKIAVSIPTNVGVEDPAALVDLAVLAEDLGFDSIWASEHLMHVSYVHARLQDRPYFHPLAALSYMAAKTSRIKLGTSVLILPFHHPFDIAKYIATMDHFSGGRVILGVGVGNVPEEFEAMNIPWRRRGAITDEALRVIKALWTEEFASFEGSHWSFSDIWTSPKPLQKPHVPLWVGGMSNAAIDRAARLGNGWHPSTITPEEFAATREDALPVLDKYDRDVEDFAFCVRVNLAIGDSVMTEGERRTVVPADDTAVVLERLTEYARAGATHCILASNSTDVAATKRAFEDVARGVLPSFS
jgi:probable F420-dependent oxidoreductase